MRFLLQQDWLWRNDTGSGNLFVLLQRAVDQMLHDVCMQNLHVIFAIDRAGLVGADGETHQGCFDLSYLTMMPNMTVMAPKNQWELQKMLNLQYILA